MEKQTKDLYHIYFHKANDVTIPKINQYSILLIKMYV